MDGSDNSDNEKGGEDKKEKDKGAMELIENRRLFLDGGILSNFPFYHCIQNEDVDESEVLGFYLNKWEDKTKKTQEGLKDIFSFVKCFAGAVFNYTDKTGRKTPKSDKACLISMKINTLDRYDMELIHSIEKRRCYISNGYRMCMEQMVEQKILVPLSIDSGSEQTDETVIIDL
jgi:predicted acylesterase/phospholipase RssA